MISAGKFVTFVRADRRKPITNRVKMASFDFVDVTIAGYREAWRERHYLVRLAAVPVLVKFICVMATVVLGVSADFIKQALICLPYFFTEGWLLVHVVRLHFCGQRWPFRSSGNAVEDEKILQVRFRAVMAGLLVYVLLCLAESGLMQLVLPLIQVPPDQAATAPAAGGLFLLLLAVGMLWAVRLNWLYIPAALNYPMGRYLRDLGGLWISFPMIGVWLMSVVPLSFLARLLTASFSAPGSPLEFLFIFVQVAVNSAVVIVTALAMSHALRQALGAAAKPRR